MESLTEFLKHASLLDLLVILVTVILILAGLLTLVVKRSRRSVRRLFFVALAPLLLGCLAMYLKHRILNNGLGMFGRLSDEALAAGRQEALIIACVGAAGTIVLVLIGLLGLALEKGEKN